MLSDDEGYLWIAAGDVAGHGYSCAIAQAMTKAALASLVGRGRTPAEVLQRMDRVLRAAGPTRNFTSLPLLRLRPETGEGLLSNAGHPYPLLVGRRRGRRRSRSPPCRSARGPRDIRGPRDPAAPRRRASSSARTACSRPRTAAAGPTATTACARCSRGAAERPAEKILEALLADWRRHLRDGPAARRHHRAGAQALARREAAAADEPERDRAPPARPRRRRRARPLRPRRRPGPGASSPNGVPAAPPSRRSTCGQLRRIAAEAGLPPGAASGRGRADARSRSSRTPAGASGGAASLARGDAAGVRVAVRQEVAVGARSSLSGRSTTDERRRR